MKTARPLRKNAINGIYGNVCYDNFTVLFTDVANISFYLYS